MTLSLPPLVALSNWRTTPYNLLCIIIEDTRAIWSTTWFLWLQLVAKYLLIHSSSLFIAVSHGETSPINCNQFVIFLNFSVLNIIAIKTSLVAIQVKVKQNYWAFVVTSTQNHRVILLHLMLFIQKIKNV